MQHIRAIFLVIFFFPQLLRSTSLDDHDNHRLKKIISWYPENIFESGKNSLIAVIDSGVDASKEELKISLLTGWDFLSSYTSMVDTDGHGTAVIGIIKLIAPNAKILPLRVAHNGCATKKDLINAIAYAIEHNATIINLSISVDEDVLLSVRAMVGLQKFNNSILVLAAGNSGKVYPALKNSFNNVIAVSATTLDYPINRTHYSVYGDAVDIAAPAGEANDGITTLNANSIEHRQFNGTSAATPVVAAAIALLQERMPLIAPAELKLLLIARSCLLYDHNRYKLHVLNIGKLLNYDYQCPQGVSLSDKEKIYLME